ncbi:MAG: F0F1 ATP synthase subunit alpha, partial [Peptoniphilaceae bacterium]
MNLRSKEIGAVIREQIKNYNVDLVMEDVGTVIEVGDGIARIWGLEDAKAGELIEFPGGIYGMVQN